MICQRTKAGTRNNIKGHASLECGRNAAALGEGATKCGADDDFNDFNDFNGFNDLNGYI